MLETLTLTQVSTHILRNLVTRAEAALGERVTAAVVTVPARYSLSQRQATMEAAAAAGLPRVVLLQGVRGSDASKTCVTHVPVVGNSRNTCFVDLGRGPRSCTVRCSLQFCELV